jgi:hypothetical protein
MSANARKRVTEGTLLTNNTTYATGGLALPAKEAFGMVRSLDSFQILGQDSGPATQYMYVWDKANAKLQMYVSHDTAGATALPLDEEGADATGTRTLRFVATGW